MPFTFEHSYARLPDAFFARIDPTPVSSPEMIALNRELASDLGIDVALLDSAEGLAILAGNRKPNGGEPIAMAYAGHQFGGFSPQLGDGRAILLGEVIGKDGKVNLKLDPVKLTSSGEMIMIPANDVAMIRIE
jgi:uncharacterized protein YdiU (UPF0061 family)